MNKFKVRSAKVSDLPKLLDFEQGIIETERPMDPTLKSGHINYYDIEAMIKSESAEVCVVTHHEKIIASGYAKIKASKDYVNHKQHAYLGFMYVDENYRGQGVNGLVVDALKAWTREQGLKEIRLEVYADNPAAIKAYEKTGFYQHIIRMRVKLD